MTCTLKKSIAVGAVMVMLALSSGCSTIRGITMPEEENLLSGAGSIMVDKSSGKAADFEKIDLATLIESYGLEGVPNFV